MLRHHAFAAEWFKINTTVDLEGRYRLVDRDEFDQALAAGLSSIPEVAPFTRASWAGT